MQRIKDIENKFIINLMAQDRENLEENMEAIGFLLNVIQTISGREAVKFTFNFNV